MSSKTRIVVFHMKEIIYTAIFAALGILLVLLLLFMFLPDHSGKKQTSKEYTPGIYTASMTLNNTPLEVEVSVDKNHINSIRFSNLDESVETMYPLVQPAMEEIAGQIIETQSADQIKSGEDDSYTSNLILDTIQKALKKSRGRLICCPGFPLSFYNQILPFRKHKHFGTHLRFSCSVIPSTSAPDSSRYSFTSSSESSTTAMQSSRNSSASSKSSATGSSKS